MSTAAPRPWSAPAWGDAELVSGEAVELDVRAARIGSRVLALLLDVGIQLLFGLLLAALVGLGLAALPDGAIDAASERALLTIGVVLLLVGYPVLFERFNHGRTPGKAAVGLRVVGVDGAPVGIRQSLARALAGVAVEWPGLVLPLLSWVAGMTVMLSDTRGRRLGDLVAGTMVVHTRTATRWRPVPAPVPALRDWAYTLDLSRLDPKLALATRQYLARAHLFTGPAADDLALRLWREVATAVTPPPPGGLPAAVYLAAVLGERHRRARHRLAEERVLTAALWPRLGLLPEADRPVGPASAPLGVPWPRPAAPGHPGAVAPEPPPAPVPAQSRPAVRPSTVAGSDRTPVPDVEHTPGRP
ncbi:RDD family protein [Micromonospora craniellae]|uniref:RDD family protein n=1 Tax=Micromonospora craniellae TaxID=2294034 RepID=A0A372FX35_9ACTN|nr:RDD family protein [Micromonospora craniellae]QOC93555.1 RDD family protein [Micromonospora craniellae]RFS45029.1 RDD family protein [Micromonospora craniellae]